MISVVLEYKAVVKKITVDQDNGLCEFELSRAEWDVVKDLCDVLQILKDATLYFSCLMPSLAMVIPAMDHINTVLATATLDKAKFSAPIRAALTVAKDHLNVYYDRTDQSKVYHIAMVLHPQRKLTYFCDANWPVSWINEAQERVTYKFERKYKGREPGVTGIETTERDDAGTSAPKVRNTYFVVCVIPELFLRPCATYSTS
ncbi:hypothetical protein ARMGADRAFT_942226 [Armillaria gallica]|uniref:hAT-like transposase RNase-H fold domain-containing protein n=1 Tax=Armillaria gallica TaxID=47427 RepID=A0A2H3DAD4_ARMGA|nr:hypothetical protein ARMGADRAFT_942226 [Armillaria gallica]